MATLALGLATAQAADLPQSPPPAFSVNGRLTATDNGNLADSDNRRADVVASMRPSLRWRRRSAGLDVDLDAAAEMLGYVNGTQRSAVLPDVGASVRANVIDQWLTLYAASRIKQVEADAFGTRVDDAQTSNRRTAASYSVRPQVERLLATNTLLLASYDARLQTNGAGAGDRAVVRRGVARVEHLPDPLGAAVEFSRLDARTPSADAGDITVATARASGSALLWHDWVLGAVLGQERSTVFDARRTTAVYGLQVKWNPTTRTDVSANVEHRFFGTGGEVVASHRTPSLQMQARLWRQPALTSVTPGLFGNDLRAFLDAILKTRYPDQAAREGVVDTLVKKQGLGAGHLLAANDIVAGYPQVETAADAHLTLLGRRDIVTVALYAKTTQLLTRPGEPAPPGLSVDHDARQQGASAMISHALTPQMLGRVETGWSRITGLANRSGDRSSEVIVRASLLRDVSPHWSLSAGVQYNSFDTTVATDHPYRATAAFVGAAYRF